MKPLLYAAAIATIGAQANALSCMQIDPITTFQMLAEEPESYFVLYGELTFDESKLPEGGSFDTPAENDPIAGRFAGKGLTVDGFTNTYNSNVFLEVGCAGPWCGSARSGGEAVYFVPLSEPPVTFQAGPCGGRIFSDPTPAVLDMLTSCMQGGTCTPVDGR